MTLPRDLAAGMLEACRRDRASRGSGSRRPCGSRPAPPAPARCRGRAGMQRMIGRERRADLEVGDDARAEPFGERDARVPGLELRETRPARITGRLALRSNSAALRDRAGGRRAVELAACSACASIGATGAGELLLLQFRRRVDVSRAARRGLGDPVGAQHRLRARRRARPAGRPIWCSRAPARPGRARCGSSRSTAGASRHRPGRWRRGRSSARGRTRR